MTPILSDLKQVTPHQQKSQALWLILGSCLVWTLAQWGMAGNLDSYNDMLESFAWGQDMPWGTFKHPPFFAWVAHAWFTVFPRTTLSCFFL
ncbi:MAG: hypothetical protein Q4G39_03400 [Brachymonas sp.]|nr:hypothetical protein [Brachymonas sp.]